MLDTYGMGKPVQRHEAYKLCRQISVCRCSTEGSTPSLAAAK